MTYIPRVTPEAVGLSSRCILRMLDRLAEKQVDLTSILLLRQDKVLFEAYWTPYDPAQLRTVYSMSKTFTALAVGMAVGDGVLRLKDRVVDLFPEQAQHAPQSPELEALTLRHLLTMSTGQGREPFHQPNAWTDMITAFLREPFKDAPGQTFRYNTAASYMLAAALKQKGIDLEAYLQARLFAPMGITGTRWLRDPHDICAGGFGLSLHAEDIARLGILLLHEGCWEGRQLVPAAFVRAASQKQINNGANPTSDWAQGYGYQMWRCCHDGFRADGMYGQFCVVHPALETILVTNGVSADMQEILCAYYEEVLTQYTDAPLPEDTAAQAALHQQAAALHYTRPAPADDGGQIPAAYLREGLLPQGLCLHLTDEKLLVTDEAGEVRYAAARGAWHTIHRAVHCEPFVTRDLRDAPAQAAWGMTAGKLTLKMFEPEFVEEDTLTLEQTASGIHVCLRNTTLGDTQAEVYADTFVPAK